MGMAMTMLSFAMLVSFAGFNPRPLHPSDLDPVKIWASHGRSCASHLGSRGEVLRQHATGHRGSIPAERVERTGPGASEVATAEANQAEAAATTERNSSEGATEMNCINHPETPAVAYCRTCGKALCEACQHTAQGTVYCAEHLPATASTPVVPQLPAQPQPNPPVTGYVPPFPPLGTPAPTSSSAGSGASSIGAIPPARLRLALGRLRAVRPASPWVPGCDALHRPGRSGRIARAGVRSRHDSRRRRHL